MGTTVSFIETIQELDNGNWIDIITLIVNALLGWWIVHTLQSNLANKRVLKDHFIKEVLEIREDYRTFFSKIGQMNAREILVWFQAINIKITDVNTCISEKYDILDDVFLEFQVTIPNSITNSTDYIAAFTTPNPIIFSQHTMQTIMRLYQQNNSVFNSIIIAINDHK